MKLEEIHAEIDKDMPIDQTDLGIEACRSSRLFTKYQRLYIDNDLLLSRLYAKRKRMWFEKREYYSGNAPASVYQAKPFNLKLKTDAAIQKYIDCDPEILDLDDKIDLQKAKVKAYEGAMKEIERRGYAIKDAIAYEKFKNGF